MGEQVNVNDVVEVRDDDGQTPEARRKPDDLQRHARLAQVRLYLHDD